MAARKANACDKEALQLAMDLMAIPGRSGQESQIAAEISRRLMTVGVPESAISFDAAHRRSGGTGECGNLIVKLPGTLRQPRRLLMAHMDTVPLCVGSKPSLNGNHIRSKDRQTGLGGDNRAGVATVLSAALTILRAGLPHPPLTLLFPVQEEVGIVGVRHLNVSKLGKPALCFNWDGGDPRRVIVGATGAISMKIVIRGIASHAGVHPEHGVSAAVVAAEAIADLQNNGWHGLIVKSQKTGTSNVGSIRGGEATNVVMPELQLTAEARSHDPQFREKIAGEFESAFRRSAERFVNHEGRKAIIEFHRELKYESFRLDESLPAVSAAKTAIKQASLEPELVLANGGLDANWMTAHGLPTVTLGCGQHDIHTVNETLDVSEFHSACRIALALATATEEALSEHEV